MKKFAPLLVLALVAIHFSSCTDDDAIRPADVSTALAAATWKVSLFTDGSNNETESFAGYEFTFTITNTTGSGSGLVEATNGSSDVVGTWSSGTSDKKAKLTLNFAINPFEELNEDWRVTEKSDTSIKLEHVSGDETDILTFEKK